MASFSVSVGSSFQSSIAYPPGSVIAYLGTSDPSGWIICDGVTRWNDGAGNYNNLINLGIGSGVLSNYYTPPNYKGSFLRGTGSANGYTGPSVRGYQDMAISQHGHTASSHKHYSESGSTHYYALAVTGGNTAQGTDYTYWEYDTLSPNTGLNLNNSDTSSVTETTNSTTINGISGISTPHGAEVRPFNYGVNWIIKL
jgi:hypothetical protein